MKKWIWGTVGLSALLWLLCLPEGALANLDFFMGRRQFMNFTGYVAFIMMAAVMVLALRLPIVERMIGGLDRVYRLHKWMGIWAATLGLVHWLMAQVPKWLVQAGVLTRPARQGAVQVAGAVPEFSWIKFAETVGEWAAWLMVALMIVALAKKIPYHWFRRAHKLFAVVFLAITFHSVILVPSSMWLTPAGVLGAFAALAGSIAAVYSLFLIIGEKRKHQSVVTHIERFPGNIISVTCELQGRGMQYLPGQFAFARVEGAKDPHPFSMSSSGTVAREVTFCIKALGDDTGYLHESLKLGDLVEIEGPYGHFNFARDHALQEEVWVAGGVGVAPFLARLEFLAKREGTPADSNIPPIQFYYCSQYDNGLLEKVADLCDKAGVQLHVFDQTQHGPLTLEKVAQSVQALQKARLWFCGPTKLGNALQHGWRSMGLPLQRFHREYFEMR